MNGVELARQVAAGLYVKAVARGRDPWQPYAFAVEEAQRRGFDVESAARGAAVLDSSRATLIVRDALIVHEAVGTMFEQAFLVAHEIGHLELGDDVDGEPVGEIDLARSAVPSPVGIDRVVDYGRRQRREIQMDLFAREFLLPRHVVRKLHLEDKLTASAIAERLGAPFEVVGQQLIDALLLPEVSSGGAKQGREWPLNPLQAEAAAHRGCAYLLEAGPGTGKTQTLVGRVESFLGEGVDPRRILLLTFSNKAAGEMADRIAEKNKDAAAAMWIGTFHAFGLDLIRRFHSELGLPKDPRMMDRTEAAELLEQEFPRLDLIHYANYYDPTQNIADILAAISRAKDEVVDAEQYSELARRMIESAESPEDRKTAERAAEVARVYGAYELLKRQAQCIDFGDLVSLPVRLLEKEPAIRDHLLSLYDHVLVDEYQDVNRSSVRLLAALCDNGENLWAVGDAKQSIYRFRGASAFNMTRFGTEDFAGGIRGRLKQNYRSTERVVATFSDFALGMKVGDKNGDLKAERGTSGKTPELRTADNADQEVVLIADTIEEMRREGHGYSAQAVLCTGNEKLSRLGLDLERLGIPVLFLGNLFERPEVKDLLSLLGVLVDRRAMGLVRLAGLSQFMMPLADVSVILDHLRADPPAGSEWLSKADTFVGLSEQGSRALAALGAALEGFDQTASPWVVLATVLIDRTRLAAEIALCSETASRARGIAIWQLLNFLRVQPAGQGLPIVRLLNRIRRLLRLGDDRDLRRLPEAAQGIDAVKLMTIHGAKGLEFPVVHLPGLNKDTIPRTPPAPPCPLPTGMVAGVQGNALDAYRAGHAEEQECLFYVALSRSRDRLILYAPTQRFDGARRPISPFVEKIGSRLKKQHLSPSRQLPVAPEASAIELVVDGNLRFSGQQIALFEKCPRRFFYTHVLQVGGRRTATAFMQMHEAVRSVFQSVISGDPPVSNEEQLERRVVDAFSVQGLANHGYASDYKALAMTMVRYFVSIREGHQVEARTALSLKFGEEEVVIQPDDVLVRSDGSRTLRSVRTGHQRSTESKDVDAAAFVLAAQRMFPDAVVELVHLSDQTVQQVSLSPKELQNRQRKLSEFLVDIRLGRFPTEQSRSCPGCPAFFICGPLPSGALKKKFG